MKRRKIFLESFKPLLNGHKKELPFKMKLKSDFITDSWFSAKEYNTENINNTMTYDCKFEKEYVST